jgi:hypothetical protein
MAISLICAKWLDWNKGVDMTSLHSASFKPTHAPSAQLLFPDKAFGSDPGASY